MKIVAVNGGPRKGKNTDQMLDAFIEGVKEVNPEAEVQVIRLYDYKYTGCISCFSCQLKNHREDLQCWIKDDITQLLKDTYHADGIVFASPVYYSNVSSQLRSFWERLLFPGAPDHDIPTAMIYTMNMNEEQRDQFLSAAFATIDRYFTGSFHVKPDVVTACNTYEYNDNENFIDEFRGRAPAKWAHHEEHFEIDLQNAREAGKRLVESLLRADA